MFHMLVSKSWSNIIYNQCLTNDPRYFKFLKNEIIVVIVIIKYIVIMLYCYFLRYVDMWQFQDCSRM